MCISLNKTNRSGIVIFFIIITFIINIVIRIRLIVSSTDISEEAELRLTSMLNETIKNYWVALGEMAIMTMMMMESVMIFVLMVIGFNRVLLNENCQGLGTTERA